MGAGCSLSTSHGAAPHGAGPLGRAASRRSSLRYGADGFAIANGAHTPPAAAPDAGAAADARSDRALTYAVHELRNALHVLDATAACADGPLTQETQDLLAAARTTALVVGDIIALTRLRDGLLEHAPEVVDVRQLLRDAVSSAAKLSPAPVRLCVGRDVPDAVVVDPALLAHIVADALAAAAWHASPRGAVVVVASGRRRTGAPPAAPQLTVEVLDEGGAGLGGLTHAAAAAAAAGVADSATAAVPAITGRRAQRAALLQLPVATQIAALMGGSVELSEVAAPGRGGDRGGGGGGAPGPPPPVVVRFALTVPFGVPPPEEVVATAAAAAAAAPAAAKNVATGGARHATHTGRSAVDATWLPAGPLAEASSAGDVDAPPDAAPLAAMLASRDSAVAGAAAISGSGGGGGEAPPGAAHRLSPQRAASPATAPPSAGESPPQPSPHLPPSSSEASAAALPASLHFRDAAVTAGAGIATGRSLGSSGKGSGSGQGAAASGADIGNAVTVAASAVGPPAGAPPPRVVIGLDGAPLRLHVLLVDDERVIRRTGAAFLDALGCTSVCLEDGDQVETALAGAARPFDAIVLDIAMHRTDGAAVCAALRKRWGARCPIVAMTGSATATDRVRYYGAGFDQVLVKPFTRESLGRALVEGQQRRGGNTRYVRMGAVGSAATPHPAAPAWPLDGAAASSSGDTPAVAAAASLPPMVPSH